MTDQPSDYVPLRRLLSETDRQAVLDAAAVLQVRRTEIASALAQGPVEGVEIIASAASSEDVNRQLTGQFDRWRELHSVRTWASVEQMRFSLPNNRRLLERGLRMSSVFDVSGVGVGALLLLANEPVGDYFVSVAPVQMKIVNRSQVMLQGPAEAGRGSLMLVRSAACLDAAWRYWDVVRKHAVPAREWAGEVTGLSTRQRQVVALMANGLGDDAIADTLGVSVRTVRADIAALLDQLGVRTRFAAGVRLQLWPDTTG